MVSEGQCGLCTAPCRSGIFGLSTGGRIKTAVCAGTQGGRNGAGRRQPSRQDLCGCKRGLAGPAGVEATAAEFMSHRQDLALGAS